MKKIIVSLICVGFIFGIVDISFADSWNARKKQVQKLLKKNNLVSCDRFKLVYGQKITDRMSNHYVYILQDTQTDMEYLIYTVGDGNSTIINNLAITPLLQPQSGLTSTLPVKENISQPSTEDNGDAQLDADSNDEDQSQAEDAEDTEESDEQQETDIKI